VVVANIEGALLPISTGEEGEVGGGGALGGGWAGARRGRGRGQGERE